jgi:purine-cytosine permease-like protein
MRTQVQYFGTGGGRMLEFIQTVAAVAFIAVGIILLAASYVMIRNYKERQLKWMTVLFVVVPAVVELIFGVFLLKI